MIKLPEEIEVLVIGGGTAGLRGNEPPPVCRRLALLHKSS